MYDDKKIKKIVKKVCEEANVTTNIHPNGERAEGYSFIVTGMLYSWVIDALIKAINEASPMLILLAHGGYRTEGCRFHVLESRKSSMTRAWKSG